MDLPRPDDLMHSARQLEHGHITAEQIDRELLTRSIGDPWRNRLPALLPLSVMAICAPAIPNMWLMWSLIAAQLVATLCNAWLAGRVGKALQTDGPTEPAIRQWLVMEAVAGMIWGTMFAPLGVTLMHGIAPSTISVSLIVTITSGALVSATVPRLPHALLGGFTATSVPTILYFYSGFGPIVVIAILALLPGLLWMVTVLKTQADRNIRTEMEVGYLSRQLQESLERADYLARHDSLTGLLNRRDFAERAEQIRRQTGDRPTSAIVIDLDRFKSINDQFGHDIGDQVLVACAEMFRAQIAEYEGSFFSHGLAARWGGEEFVLLLFGCTQERAGQSAECIRLATQQLKCANWPESLSISCSIGVNEWRSNEPLSQALIRADHAMYQAKNSGRNAVALASR